MSPDVLSVGQNLPSVFEAAEGPQTSNIWSHFGSGADDQDPSGHGFWCISRILAVTGR